MPAYFAYGKTGTALFRQPTSISQRSAVFLWKRVSSSYAIFLPVCTIQFEHFIYCRLQVWVSRFVADLSIGTNHKVSLRQAVASNCPPDSCIYMVRISNSTEIIKPKEQKLFRLYWSECRDSNSRPLEPHSSAIPNFATPGFLLASLGDFDILTHLSEKCKHFFRFLKNIFWCLQKHRKKFRIQ